METSTLPSTNTLMLTVQLFLELSSPYIPLIEITLLRQTKTGQRSTQFFFIPLVIYVVQLICPFSWVYSEEHMY